MSSNGDNDGDGEILPTPRERGSDNDVKPLPPPKEALPEELQELLADLPEGERDKVTRIASIMVSSHHEGPLPPPQDFEHYERVLKGTGGEIMAMSKKEQTIKEAVLTGRVSNDRLRLTNDRLLIWVLMAGVVGMIVATALALWLDHPNAAMFLAGISVVTGLGIRLINVFSKKKDDES